MVRCLSLSCVGVHGQIWSVLWSQSLGSQWPLPGGLISGVQVLILVTVTVEKTITSVSTAVTIARWQDMKMGLENETYNSVVQASTDRALLRYDKNLTFYIRG